MWWLVCPQCGFRYPYPLEAHQNPSELVHATLLHVQFFCEQDALVITEEDWDPDEALEGREGPK